jgi:hypothetical protein
MGTSLDCYRSRLYRKLARAVTLLCIGTELTGLCLAQFAKQRKPDKGPRAVGLVKIDAKDRAQLVPVVIRIDGKFYDAGAYKADPVPMALQPGTVYEAFKSGVSQGLFTIGGAARSPEGWFADGKWRSNAQIEAAKAKAKAEAEKKAQKASEDPINSGPPRLKRPGDTSPQDSSPSSPDTKTPPASAPSATGSTSAAPASSAKDSSARDSTTKDSAVKDSAVKEDPDRPVLRRQEASETSHEQTKGSTPEPLTETVRWIPAVSDAGGPEPRGYIYQMKPEEEAEFLKKMLVIAGQEVSGRAESLGAAGTTGEPVLKPKSKASDKHALGGAEGSARPTRAPEFQNVQLHVFDLSTTNEPVLILTANAIAPSRADLVFTIALVARHDIYGELHKVSAHITDSQHLDVLPKYEFIDAVDADGDGRAELLFRLTSDAGSAYAIYSVIGDKLWPLFEGKPGT